MAQALIGEQNHGIGFAVKVLLFGGTIVKANVNQYMAKNSLWRVDQLDEGKLVAMDRGLQFYGARILVGEMPAHVFMGVRETLSKKSKDIFMAYEGLVKGEDYKWGYSQRKEILYNNKKKKIFKQSKYSILIGKCIDAIKDSLYDITRNTRDIKRYYNQLINLVADGTSNMSGQYGGYNGIIHKKQLDITKNQKSFYTHCIPHQYQLLCEDLMKEDDYVFSVYVGIVMDCRKLFKKRRFYETLIDVCLEWNVAHASIPDEFEVRWLDWWANAIDKFTHMLDCYIIVLIKHKAQDTLDEKNDTNLLNTKLLSSLLLYFWEFQWLNKLFNCCSGISPFMRELQSEGNTVMERWADQLVFEHFCMYFDTEVPASFHEYFSCKDNNRNMDSDDDDIDNDENEINDNNNNNNNVLPKLNNKMLQWIKDHIEPMYSIKNLLQYGWNYARECTSVMDIAK